MWSWGKTYKFFKESYTEINIVKSIVNIQQHGKLSQHTYTNSAVTDSVAMTSY